MENPGRTAHTPGARVRQLFPRGIRSRTPGGLVPAGLQSTGRPPVRRFPPDEHAVPDDSRPGTHQDGPRQRLPELSRPRRRHGVFHQSAVPPPVLHGLPGVEGHAEQIEPDVHVRKTQANVQSDQRLQQQVHKQFT